MAEGRIHLWIDKLNPEEKMQYKLLALIALTYRANLQTLSELFKIDAAILYQKINDYNYDSNTIPQALKFLFAGDKSDQQQASSKVLAFYLAWNKMNSIEDKEEKEKTRAKLLNIIKSPKGHDALMKLKKEEHLTDTDVLNLLNYQIKYALTFNNINTIIGRSSSFYRERAVRIMEKHPELKERYQVLCDYNSDLTNSIYWEPIRKGIGRNNG